MKSSLSLLSERREIRASEKCHPGFGCRIEPTGVVCATVCATPHPQDILKFKIFVFLEVLEWYNLNSEIGTISLTKN
jgi:hypothetical protein